MTDYGRNVAGRYDARSAAHAYLVGFHKDSRVYYVKLTFEELSRVLVEDKASAERGGMFKLRVYVNATQAAAWINSGKARYLCATSELVADKKYNKGDNFERVITETLTSTVWVKQNVPFYVKGDVNVNGEEIQVKYQKATLIDEKTLARAEALAG